MEKTKKKTFTAGEKPKRLELVVFIICAALLIVVLWPFVTVTIEGGYVGAYYSRFFGGTLTDKWYGEGVHFVFPWDAMIPYDARTQSKDYDITALTKGGLEINVNMSVLWYIKKEQVGSLHSGMGPDYADNVLDPAVMSVVRSTIGSYEQSELYDGSPLELQESVLTLLNETLVDAPFHIDSILVREVKLPDAMAEAISEKFVSEQNVLAERYRVLEAVERYKRSYVDAESVRIAQSIVNDGMSEAFLRYLGIQATLELAESNNAKLVIIGDKDGLPLILNADTLTESETLPDGISADEYIQEEGARINNFVDTYSDILERLNSMDKILDEVSGRFPQADLNINDTIPQDSKVPTS